MGPDMYLDGIKSKRHLLYCRLELKYVLNIL